MKTGVDDRQARSPKLIGLQVPAFGQFIIVGLAKTGLTVADHQQSHWLKNSCRKGHAHRFLFFDLRNDFKIDGFVFNDIQLAEIIDILSFTGDLHIDRCCVRRFYESPPPKCFAGRVLSWPGVPLRTTTCNKARDAERLMPY